MNASEWYARYRQAWILETVRVFGHINRSHIIRKFAVSEPQASLDFRRFLKENPGLITYNHTSQRYEAMRKPTARPPRPGAKPTKAK